MNKEIGIGIRKIKDSGFFINERLYKNASTQLIKIDFQQQVTFDIKKNQLSFILRIMFRYEKSSPDELLLDTQIENVFEITNLKDYVSNRGEVTLPEEIWTTIVSLSISHSRALIARNTAGTFLQDYILPIVNPGEITRAFFPKLEKIKPSDKK